MKPLISLIIILSITAVIRVYGAESSLSAYLPRADELSGWAPSGEAQYVEGDDLFLLINGGAEVYHEYGFKRAAALGYKSGSGKSFNFEIYEMSDPGAAYGIYTFKTGNSGKPVPVDGEGLLEDYYLNFRKGNFVVTVIGFDSEPETISGIIGAARAAAAKIKPDPRIPALVEMLPTAFETPLDPRGIKYLRGNLALFNNYEFDSKDIFHLKEGVIGDYGDFKLFIFRYGDADEGRKQFGIAAGYLAKNPRFSHFKRSENGGSMTDDKGTTFCMEQYDRYIFIVRGKTGEGAAKVFKRLREGKVPR